jgi:hypothetical protein
MGIVDGAIQRVHIPLVSEAPRYQADLFGNDLVTGEVALDFGKQVSLGLAVNFGDKVDDVFIVHMMFVPISEAQYFTGLAGQPFEICKGRVH